MKKRYWIGIGLLGGACLACWIRRRRRGKRGLGVADALGDAYGKALKLWVGDDEGLRAQLVAWAGIGSGESVLDIDRGAGGAALAAARAVGPEGEVIGLVPTEQAARRAQEQAEALSVPVTYRAASATDLPFTSARFGAVTASLGWHQYTPGERRSVISEAGRVLKLGGHLAVADALAIAEEPFVASRCFGIVKTDRVRQGASTVHMVLAERIAKNPPGSS